ncbi:metallophosphoesterase family protein [Chitinispirillales bacterium ANBcel5]|uniref:metallophosphoesterase family protein n=1 Tax=Cellulosispirillum alkaliphilum TaxID=3039283 RepID=UPI002A4F09E6|nr:metallophosphoesterase family protein [Chitinispirillales bacterium ANBcel5]
MKKVVAAVISDTHNLLRAELIKLLNGVDLIIHAGDIGDDEIMASLESIAPLHAVRGNTDYSARASTLPLTDIVRVGSAHLYVIHNIAGLDIDPLSAGISAVVYGHSHRACSETKDGVLYFNPGSAGPVRFNLPVTVGFITEENGKLSSRIERVI